MFPYCAACQILINCNLWHEMGHFIYERTGLEQELDDQLRKKVLTFFRGNQIPEEVKGAPLLAWHPLLNYVRNLMLAWANETFADVFAVRVLGPAFHLAYEEIEQVIPRTEKTSFSETHPADDFRFRIHAKWLSEDGWDEVLKERVPVVFEELERCKALRIEKFSVGCAPPLYFDGIRDKLHKWMLEEFDKMVGKIENTVANKLDRNFEGPLADYAKNCDLVRSCLEHAVVPSTVCDEGKEFRYPDPRTMLNVGFFFYRSGMESLLRNVKNIKRERRMEIRLRYERRLNEWLGKAIDDWQLLRQKGKA